MTQALHIFRKDLRHLWPECGVYVLLLLVFGIAAPQAWSGSGSTLVQTALRLLAFLIPVAFFVLIVRVVHEERLVGVDQFWITRPYRWTSLLIAKCIFILTCVILPLVLMQYWLISRAGFGLLASSPAMSRSLLTACVHVIVPFMLVAAITSTLTEAFMVLAGIIVTWLCILLTFFSGEDMNMSPHYSWAIMAGLFTMLLIGVLIYQYAKRRTSQSRIAFIVIVTLFVLLLYGFSAAHFGAPVRAMIRDNYPLSTEPSLRLVALPGSLPYADREKDMHVPKGSVEVKLPVRLEGLPSEYKLRNPNISVTVDALGLHYISPWQAANIGYDVLSFLMPQKVFDSAARDAHLHLEFLAEKLRPGASQVVTASSNFSAPDDGRCSLNYGVPNCRYAFRMLTPTRVQASDEHNACGSSHFDKPLYASLHAIPNGGRIDPVIQQDIRFDRKICPGTQLTFSQYVPAGKFRLELDIPSIEIAQYKAR